MKRKAITSTFQGMERRLTRLQAKATASSSTVLSPAQVDSPTAPSGYVQSHAIVGDKTKEYNNIRIAETSIENNSASEGTFNTENFNSKLVGQNQGREESDRDALALVTAKNISGVTVATITSNTTSGRQVAAEEARVISNVVLEIAKEVNSCKTTDEHLRPTYSIGLSEMANMFAADDSNQDEVQSFLFDPALISVQGYRVKEASATILRNVARNCFVETVESRSFFLEKVCEIIQTLQTTKFVNITQTEVEKMLALVGDLERVNLGVGWVQKRLEEILEVIKLIKQSSQLKESRGRNAQIIQESKRALKSYEARILVHEAEIEALKEKASLEKEKMNAAQAEDRIITQRVSNLKPKVKRFIKESFVHDLQ